MALRLGTVNNRGKNSTLKKMIALTLGLIAAWGFGIYYNFAVVGKFVVNKKSVDAGVKSILMVVIAVAVCLVCDVITTLLKHKKGKGKLGQEIVHDLVHNYSWVSGIIFALTLPVYVSYYVIIIGSIFATMVVKNVFGGFGKNIFNPALFARIFVGLCFTNAFAVPSMAGIDVMTGATITTAYNNTQGWLDTTALGTLDVFKGVLVNGFSLKDIVFGNYVGALGETCFALLIVVGIVLAIFKVIDWRTPLFYLGTVAVTAFVVGQFVGVSEIWTYVVGHLALGGLAFGAVFMLTDPVTTPISPLGRIIAAIFAGFMTVLIRIKGGYPEGVMFSIALVNLVTPLIDHLITGRIDEHIPRKAFGVLAMAAVLVAVNTLIAVPTATKKNLPTDAYGYSLNAAQARTYGNLIETKDGEIIRPMENAAIHTDGVTTYTIEGEKHEFAPVVAIVNENEEIVAMSYFVTGQGIINTGYANKDVTAYGYVTIEKGSDTIRCIHFIEEHAAYTNGYNAGQGTADAFAGMTIGQVNSQPDVVGGCSFTTPIVKDLIAKAYAEHAFWRN